MHGFEAACRVLPSVVDLLRCVRAQGMECERALNVACCDVVEAEGETAAPH